MIPCCSRADLYNVNELDFTFNIGFTLILSWEVHKYTHTHRKSSCYAYSSMVYTLTHVGTGRPNLHALHCSRRSRRQHVAIGSMQPLLAAADLVAQRLPMCGHTRGSLRATILPCQMNFALRYIPSHALYITPLHTLTRPLYILRPA